MSDTIRSQLINGPKNANGTVLLAVTRADKTLLFQQCPARITDERIRTLTRTFDRETGKRLNRWHPSMGTVALVAYRLGNERMTVLDPKLMERHEAAMGVQV